MSPRVQLVFEVAGQEAQAFAGFDGGPGQDDPFDLAVLQSPDGQGDGNIGLAGAGRSDGKDQITVEVGLDHLLLGLVAGPDGFPVRSVDDDGIAAEAELPGGILAVENVFHVIDGQVHLAVTAFDQFSEPDVEFLDLGTLSLYDQFVPAGDDFQAREIGAEFFQDFVSDPEDLDGVHGFQRNGFLHVQYSIPVSATTLARVAVMLS